MTTKTIVRALSILILLAGAAGAAHAADLTPWDQATVTELATELEKSSENAYTTAYKVPDQFASPRVPYYHLRQNLRRIHAESIALRDNLKDGHTQEETLGVWKHIAELVDDLNVNERESFITSDVKAAIDQMMGILKQIAPYYEADWQIKS